MKYLIAIFCFLIIGCAKDGVHYIEYTIVDAGICLDSDPVTCPSKAKNNSTGLISVVYGHRHFLNGQKVIRQCWITSDHITYCDRIVRISVKG